MSTGFKDLQCNANVSDYKWLSKTLKTAQQQQAVRPFYQCKIIDDSVIGDVVSNPGAPLHGSVCVAPDGNMFAVGLDSSNNVGVWKGDQTVLSGAPTSILENDARNRAPCSNYSIACSDWINGSYKLDVYFFGNWDNDFGTGFLTICHYYSMDKGVTWSKIGQSVRDTTIVAPYLDPLNKWIVAGQPFQDPTTNNIFSTVFYITPSGSYFDIAYQQYLGTAVQFQPEIVWSAGDINTKDWNLHSLDVKLLDGFWYVAFSGFRAIFDGTNQDTSILNYNIYITKIVSFSNTIGLSIWSPPEQIITALSTSTQNKNSFTYPSLFYDDSFLWISFCGQVVSSVQNNNGNINVVTNSNYYLAKSKDFYNFHYPIPVIFNNILFSNALFYSFFLLGSSYWIAGGGQLGKFIINNIVADISNDIISYQTNDVQQNPSTININIGNANGKWRGATPTEPGYQAIANNKKICLFQGYYNALGISEVAPKNTFYIDDIQQNIQTNRNDFSLLGRDFYKKLSILKTNFSFNYEGIKKYVDLFTGTTLGNYNFNSGTWKEQSGFLQQISFTGDTLAIFNLYHQTRANTTFSVTAILPSSALPAGSPIYIYFYYVDSDNYARLYVDSNGGGITYDYKIQVMVAGISTDVITGTFSMHGRPSTFFPFLFKRTQFFMYDIYVGKNIDSGEDIDAFDIPDLLALNLDISSYFTGLGDIAFGTKDGQGGFGNFRYLEFDTSLSISELIKKIATKAEIFDYKISTLFEDYFFNPSNYSGVFTTPNRVLTIPSSQTVMKNDLQISDSEIEFEGKITSLNGNTNITFDFIFRNTGLVNQNENYFITFLLALNGFGVVVATDITLYNNYLNVPYSLVFAISKFDLREYHKYKITFFNQYIFLSIDGMVVLGWYDNNITQTHSTGYIGFRTWANMKLEIKSNKGNDIYSQIETFSINPGDDLQNSSDSLLSTTRAYFFSDLMGRFKILQLNSTDPSTYTYQNQITTQQVDNSDKEYVNQVTVIGTNVQATVQDVTSINSNSIVREEVIVDYKIMTYQDALTRANLELTNFNKFNNQYNPKNILNVGSELYDVVTVINIGDNSSNVNQVVRNYSQEAQVGGNKLSYWQTINTGKL